MKKLAFTVLLLTACASAPKPGANAGADMPDSGAHSEAMLRALKLRAEGSDLLYSKDPKIKDPVKAYDRFLEAANLGDPVSMDQLGGFHSTGLAGKEKSCKLALEWFEKAAGLGYELAANNLAYTLVTCEDKKLRDSQRAEDVMQFLFGRNQSFLAILDTYAAVLAEQGNFPLAAKTMDTVIDIAELIKASTERIDEFKHARSLYAKKKTIAPGKEADPGIFKKTN